MKTQVPLSLTLFSALAAGCIAGSAAEAPDTLLAEEIPTKVTQSTSGDFFVDSKTELNWSTRISVSLEYSEAHFYCASLGYGWRLPTIGELKTMTQLTGKKRTMRPAFRKGLSDEGVLFSGEEIPVIDDDKQPLVMQISNGRTFNGHGREGYVRCAHGPVTRKKAPFREPAGELLGERWWDGGDACPSGSIARGTLGIEVSCKSEQGEKEGRTTNWNRQGRSEATYRKGLLHGELTRWRPNGGKSSRFSYRSGEFHGRTAFWYPSGIKSKESNFSSGLLDGWQERWDQEGELQLRTRYRKGRIVEQLHYDHGKLRNGTVKQKHANGVDSYVGDFKKGRATGRHYGYHANGKLRFKRSYSGKGVPHGASANWHENGQAHEVSTFKNGALQGERVIFNARGKVLTRNVYDQGVVRK